jgi:hypothetical protein
VFAAALARARDGAEGARGGVEKLHGLVDGGSIAELEDICLTTGGELKKVRDALTQLEEAAVLRYAAHAGTLRTSDLDTGFFHTDMKVLADQLPRSAHCSLLRTHKPGSPLLLCPARTPVPLAQVLTHCRLL